MREASGRFVVRVEPQVHARLRDLARDRGISLNRFCREVLGREVKAGNRPEAPTGFEALVGDCRRAVGDDLEGIVLFGSLARGDQTAASDADLLLVMRPGVPIRRRLYDVWEERVGEPASAAVGREVTPHFVGLPPDASRVSGLWLEVSIDGVVLWDRSGEVIDLLRRIRLELSSGSLRREVRHGHPYWVREAAQ